MAIYKPSGKAIKKQWLLNSYLANKNGSGLAIANHGQIRIIKGLFTFDQFFSHYKEHEQSAMLIHFRFATHGAVNVENCHPWPLCNGRLAMIHNGVLPIKQTIKHLSDSGNFANLVLTPMLEKIDHHSPALKYLIEQSIGNSNKVIVMDSNGNATIYNEKAGSWRNGSWFSNDGYLPACKPYWRQAWPFDNDKPACQPACDAWNEELEAEIEETMIFHGMTRNEAIEYLNIF